MDYFELKAIVALGSRLTFYPPFNFLEKLAYNKRLSQSLSDPPIRQGKLSFTRHLLFSSCGDPVKPPKGITSPLAQGVLHTSVPFLSQNLFSSQGIWLSRASGVSMHITLTLIFSSQCVPCWFDCSAGQKHQRGNRNFPPSPHLSHFRSGLPVLPFSLAPTPLGRSTHHSPQIALVKPSP